MPTPRQERSRPLTPAIMLASDPAKGSPGAVHEQLPQIHIASLADTEQARLTARGMLPWDYANHAAHCQPFFQWLASLTAATRAVAVSGPLPGTVPRR